MFSANDATGLVDLFTELIRGRLHVNITVERGLWGGG